LLLWQTENNILFGITLRSVY